MKSPYSAANHLSTYGRYGDDQLVHMSGQEVAVLDGIAAAFGRELTRNPHTGMKEAFNLFDVLPIALQFIPGIGTAAGIALSAASGAASQHMEGGDWLKGALMGGLTGAAGAALKGPADVALEATKGGLDAATKGIAAAPAATGELAADMTGSLLANADKAAMMSNMPTSQILPGAADAMSSGFDYAKAAASPIGAGPVTPPPSSGFLTDIFGEGSDKAVQDFIGRATKGENLPLTLMGISALGSLPTMGGYSDEAPMGEEPYVHGDWSRPARRVNPNYGYDPNRESAAFTTGVNYAGGFASGGPVRGLRGYKGGGSVGADNSAPVGPVNSAPVSGVRSPKGGVPAGNAPQPQQVPYQQVPLSQPMAPMPQPTLAGLTSGGILGGQTPQNQAPIGASSFAGTPEFARGYFDRINQMNNERNNLSMMSQALRGGQQDQAKPAAEQPQVNPGMPQSGTAAAPMYGPRQDQQMEAFRMGGMVRGYAMGGMVDQAMQMDDRTVVKEAMAAIMGQSQNPEEAIAMFVDRFGEEALQMLVQKVRGGGQGRYVQGAGDGLSDSIPAVVDGQQPSALSTGEFVIPADAVSHLGNGDNKTGAKELYSMIDRLRQARTGNSSPPPAINQRGIMPA